MSDPTKKKFRGTFIPARLHQLVESRTITCQELVLLATVEALTNSDDHEGCWASKSYLSDLLGIEPRRLQRIIQKLLTLKLLIHGGFKITKTGRFRMLYTYFSAPRGVEYEKTPRGEYEKTPNNRCLTTSVQRIPSMAEPSEGTQGENSFTSEVPQLTTDRADVFFPDITRNSKVSRFDSQCADQLKHAVRMRYGGNTAKWADEFRKLRTVDGVPFSQVQNVLDWYCNNHATLKNPKVANAKHFRKVFTWLTDLMEKDVSDVIVTPEAQAVADRLTGQSLWPKVSKQEVAKGTQLMLNRARVLLAKLVQVRNHHAESDGFSELASFIDHIKGMGYVTPVNLTHRLMLLIYHSIKNWQDWSGDLSHQLWDGTLTHKHLNGLGQTWAKEYSNNPNLWQQLVEAVK